MALVDLFGDGLPDVLQSSPAGFRYWRNLGGGLLDRPRFMPQIPAGIALWLSQEWDLATWAVMAKPICWCIPVHCQVSSRPRPTAPGRRSNPTTSFPSFDLADPNVRLVDLTGDGSSDALMTRDEHFLWFECLGEKGFAPPKHIRAQARSRSVSRMSFSTIPREESAWPT